MNNNIFLSRSTWASVTSPRTTAPTMTTSPWPSRSSYGGKRGKKSHTGSFHETNDRQSLNFLVVVSCVQADRKSLPSKRPLLTHATHDHYAAPAPIESGPNIVHSICRAKKESKNLSLYRWDRLSHLSQSLPTSFFLEKEVPTRIWRRRENKCVWMGGREREKERENSTLRLLHRRNFLSLFFLGSLYELSPCARRLDKKDERRERSEKSQKFQTPYRPSL